MSIQPLWWRRVGLGFVRGVSEDSAVLVEQVKAALWDDEINEGSSSGVVDEGRRAIAVDDVFGEEAPAGQR